MYSFRKIYLFILYVFFQENIFIYFVSILSGQVDINDFNLYNKALRSHIFLYVSYSWPNDGPNGLKFYKESLGCQGSNLG